MAIADRVPDDDGALWADPTPLPLRTEDRPDGDGDDDPGEPATLADLGGGVESVLLEIGGRLGVAQRSLAAGLRSANEPTPRGHLRNALARINEAIDLLHGATRAARRR